MDTVIIASTIKSLSNSNVNKEYYKIPGVWALYGRKLNGKWQCLEVAKTVDIYGEVQSAIYILTTPDDVECEKCSDTHPARQKFEYSAKFNIHNCKKCQHTSKLRIASWKRNPRYIDKYKDMLKQEYIDFRFVCVNISENMQDNNKREAVEEQYAKKHQALYWWDRKTIKQPYD